MAALPDEEYEKLRLLLLSLCQIKTNTAGACLDLSFHCIGPKDAKAIADRLKANTTLRELDLFANEIGDLGAKYIADALIENKAIRVLNLNDNEITSVGALAILHALKTNTTVIKIDLGSNDVAHSILDAIQRKCHLNSQAQHRWKALEPSPPSQVSRAKVAELCVLVSGRGFGESYLRRAPEPVLPATALSFAAAISATPPQTVHRGAAVPRPL